MWEVGKAIRPLAPASGHTPAIVQHAKGRRNLWNAGPVMMMYGRRGRETDTLHVAPVLEGRVTSLAQGHRRNVCLASEAGPHRWTPADGQLRAGSN
ncbi:hypothetical protein QQF64_001566 [Cirrhinus molitorella]|uniref:Uncharacterized protein n=1 Tax=Cirrhinus molitorella TaxID=172907 RepID=A0ABR3P0G6_9TELE